MVMQLRSSLLSTDATSPSNGDPSSESGSGMWAHPAAGSGSLLIALTGYLSLDLGCPLVVFGLAPLLLERTRTCAWERRP